MGKHIACSNNTITSLTGTLALLLAWPKFVVETGFVAGCGKKCGMELYAHTWYEAKTK